MILRKVNKIGKAIVAFLLLPILLLLLFQPDWLVALVAARSPEILYFVETEAPVIALTIDDGPDREATPKILDLLKQHDAHATFFLISSRIKGNEAIVRRAVAEDHEIANHMAIDRPSISLSAGEFERQLVEADQVLSAFADMHWFRPGSGWYNAEIVDTAQKHGYQIALGSVYPYDSHLPLAWFAAWHILWQVRPGSIIILHDHGGRGNRTAAVLATILPALKRRGFRIVTLSELANPEMTATCPTTQTYC